MHCLSRLVYVWWRGIVQPHHDDLERFLPKRAVDAHLRAGGQILK